MNGTTESPNLMDNHNAYDYGSEVFDSGRDSFDTQRAAINEIHEDGRVTRALLPVMRRIMRLKME